MTEQNYPKAFSPQWLFGGKKHGWSRRYKKGKSFCTLIPEKNRFAIQTVFGAEERAKVETIRDELSSRTQKEYDKAATYHDGKWFLLIVDTDKAVNDVVRLLAVKRKPENIREKKVPNKEPHRIADKSGSRGTLGQMIGFGKCTEARKENCLSCQGVWNWFSWR